MQEDLDTLVGWSDTSVANGIQCIFWWFHQCHSIGVSLMNNFIESFCKVKDCYVDLYVVVHPFGDVVGCHQQLAFA
jgi:hypothetical protein